MADQTDLEGLGRADVLAGEQDLRRVGVGDLAGQAHRRAAHRVERPADLAHPEAGRLAGHPDLHGLEDLGAARDGHALHRGHDGLGRPVVAEQGLVDDVGVLSHRARVSSGSLASASPAMARRSAPEQKLPPAPVTTMQRTSGSADASS